MLVSNLQTCRKGQLKPISVVVKIRQGRKASTLITGFEPFFLEADELAEELKTRCASATSGEDPNVRLFDVQRVADVLRPVSPAPGKSSGMEVLVQGKQLKGVTEFLTSRGVPKRWIETADLSGGGKK